MIPHILRQYLLQPSQFAINASADVTHSADLELNILKTIKSLLSHGSKKTDIGAQICQSELGGYKLAMTKRNKH